MPKGATDRLLRRGLEAGRAIPYGYEEILWAGDLSRVCSTARLASRDGWLHEEICVHYMGTIFTALIPRDVLESLEGFREDVSYGEDYDFAVRLAAACPFAWVDTCTYAARMHESNRHRLLRLEQGLADSLRTVRRNLSEGSDQRLKPLAGKARAKWLCHFGHSGLQSGARRFALSCFLRAAATRPWKLGPWRGVFRALIGTPQSHGTS